MALKSLKLLLPDLFRSSFDLLFKQMVNQHINATDKEAGDRGDMAEIFASRQSLFQGAQIGLGNLEIALDGKNERDVDIDAFGERLANGRDACWRCGNFHHQIRTINRLPEAAYLSERPFC